MMWYARVGSVLNYAIAVRQEMATAVFVPSDRQYFRCDKYVSTFYMSMLFLKKFKSVRLIHAFVDVSWNRTAVMYKSVFHIAKG